MPSSGASPTKPSPAIDDRLVASETRYEMHDGELVYVSPADPPHAIVHSKLSALLESHVGLAYDVASDMLTRTSERNDVAPDASVFPIGRDPVTGDRRLEELAFEVVSTERIGRAAHKAAELTARGVRRVFAIDVERSRVLEWSRAIGGWALLDLTTAIEDPALDVPLPLDALANAAKVDDAMGRALLAKRNPVIQAARDQDRAEGEAKGRAEGEAKGRAEGEAKGRAEGEAKGRAEGEAKGRRDLAEALLLVLEHRELSIASTARDRILDEPSTAVLKRWFARAATCIDVDALLDEPAE